MNKDKKKFPLACTCIALTGMLLLVSGCDEDTATGDLQVAWTIGLDDPTTMECTDKGIALITVSLTSSQHDEEREVACDDGSVTFQNIPKVTYSVSVVGEDDTGCPIYSGETSGARPSEEAEPEVASVTLQHLEPSGTLQIGWVFEDGGLCGANDVDEVDITVLANDVEIVNESVPCNDGIMELNPVEAGSIDVRLEAQSGETTLCYVQTNMTLDPCATLDVDAVLAPCS